MGSRPSRFSSATIPLPALLPLPNVGTTSDNQVVKVALVGNMGSGKTSLFLRVLHNTFRFMSLIQTPLMLFPSCDPAHPFSSTQNTRLQHASNVQCKMLAVTPLSDSDEPPSSTAASMQHVWLQVELSLTQSYYPPLCPFHDSCSYMTCLPCIFLSRLILTSQRCATIFQVVPHFYMTSPAATPYYGCSLGCC
jgi:hypothetical protein